MPCFIPSDETGGFEMSDIYIACKIEQGAFTSERTFEIQLSTRMRTSSGETSGFLVGTAHQMHLLDSNKQPLDDDEPGYATKVNGFVRCEKIRELSDESVLVEVPSADLIHVPVNELVTV